MKPPPVEEPAPVEELAPVEKPVPADEPPPVEEPLRVPPDLLPADAFTVVRPRYGDASLADLLPAALTVLGVAGGRDVLGLAAYLDGVRRIAVLLIDGLGAYQLELAAAYAPMLGVLAGGPRMTLTSGFPSTTPVSLVTLGTGAPPGAHGVLGFTVRHPDGGVLNHIRWRDDPDPTRWQPLPTAFEVAAAAGVAVTMVTRPQYAGTGLSIAANRGAVFQGAADLEATADAMLSVLAGDTAPTLVYGYHPDLDRSGHVEGVNSPAWRTAAQELERPLQRLVAGLPSDAALLITADHGQLNVPAYGRLDIATDPALAAGVHLVAGEPRVRYLHVAPGATDDVVAAWRGVLGDTAVVATRAEVLDDGLFGPVSAAHLDRIGDVVVSCLGRTVVLAGDHEPPAASRLIAYHGSMTAAEMTVPLLIARPGSVAGSG